MIEGGPLGGENFQILIARSEAILQGAKMKRQIIAGIGDRDVWNDTSCLIMM